jgi:hypothetical protein
VPDAGPDTGSDAPDPCATGAFELTGFQLGAGGFSVTAKPGESLLVLATWKIGNPASCPGCDRRIALGVEGEASGCLDAGTPATCPASSPGQGFASLKAPVDPGTYTVFAAPVKASDCKTALAAYADAPRTAVGTVVVAGDCPPDTCPGTPCDPADCKALDRLCGTWGDGCRHPLECGACAAGLECSFSGRCEGMCTHGTLSVSGVSLNGGGKVASSVPGGSVSFAFDLEVGNPDPCEPCGRQAVVGIDEAGPCTDLGIPKTCPATSLAKLAGTVQAPASAGTWEVAVAVPAATGCPAAKGLFSTVPDRVVAGTVHVVSGCGPKTCKELGRSCGPASDGCGVELDCGECPAGQTCGLDGTCGCTGADPYEPNDSPGDAWDLGSFTDADSSSQQKLAASLAADADWFRVTATDKPLAIMDPFVRITPGIPGPFQVQVVFVCNDGHAPSYDVQADATCAAGDNVDLTSVPAIAKPVWGLACDSSGKPLTFHFEPTCPGGFDDSGVLFVGVSATGGCTSYGLELHL